MAASRVAESSTIPCPGADATNVLSAPVEDPWLKMGTKPKSIACSTPCAPNPVGQDWREGKKCGTGHLL
ncbi:hypothetical protein SKAU_G00062760 [Synaphobranchus kaupii]|uniref:Uncharacterized protein n=1 Tax=Synaphobranchus kaupii TaxID=118154 RepID=A0A9Q1G660_SYNKA|nr:hypothetical protein SKAU_G00062760 [Synaphobranchus kaupii]